MKLEGPTAEADWVRPDNFDRFFGRDDPGTSEERKTFAREVLCQIRLEGVPPTG